MNALKAKLNQIEDIEKQLQKVESEAREIQLDYVNAISEVCCCSRNFDYNRKSKLLAIHAVGMRDDYYFWCFESQALDIYIQVPIHKKNSEGAFGLDTDIIIKVQRAINEMDNKYSNSDSERECDAVSEVRKLEKLVEDSRDSEKITKIKPSFEVEIVPYSERAKRAEKKKSKYSESIKKDISKQPDVAPITDTTFKSLDVINGELHHFDSPQTKKAYLEGKSKISDEASNQDSMRDKPFESEVGK